MQLRTVDLPWRRSIASGCLIATLCLLGRSAAAVDPLPFEQLLAAEAPTHIKVYSVALASRPFAERSAAEAIKTDFEARGYAPVFLRASDSGEWWRVMYGYYDILADAHLAARSFKERGLGEGPQVRYQTYPSAEAEVLVVIEHQGAMSSMFRLDERPMMAPPGDSPSFSLPFDSHGLDLEAAREIYEGRRVAGPGELGVSRLILAEESIAQGNREEALAHQLAVARGEGDSDDRTRVRAMWEAGLSLHQVERRLGSYQAYSELEALPVSPLDRNQCALERIELLMELAASEFGSMEDARRFGQTALREIPPQEDDLARFCRARIQRRIANTYIKSDKHAEGIVLLQAFIDEYRDSPNQRRDLAAAYNWMGYSLSRIDKLDDAAQSFRGTIELGLTSEEEALFGTMYNRSAALWLMHLADVRGDGTTVRNWAEFLLSRYPGTSEAIQASSTLERWDSRDPE